jgi:NAD(P)-dependent dehydrogenase (short-subunit alcohol dehydrogenase family)
VSTILVTGATDGLGRAPAAELRERGHDIIVHGRSRERAEAVAGEIGGAEVVLADIARLDDVRALAQTASGVDVLVNNAGIISAEQRLSEDGYELTFQVNPSSASCSRC